MRLTRLFFERIREWIVLMVSMIKNTRKLKRAAARIDAVKVDAVKVDAVKVDAVKVDGVKVDGVKVDGVKVDGVKTDVVKVDVVKVDVVKTAAVTIEAAKPEAPKANRISLELIKPEAKHVCVAGSFNEWKPERTPLVARGHGRWAGDLAVKPGRHEYLFVVDGQWVPDPNAKESVQNPFGGTNSVLVVSS